MGGRKTSLAPDFRDLLRAFVAHDVRFLVVGAYALAVLGRPRATGELDVWIDATPGNRGHLLGDVPAPPASPAEAGRSGGLEVAAGLANRATIPVIGLP